MPIPFVKDKKKSDFPRVPPKRKLSTDKGNVEAFERCRKKHQKIKKLLRNKNQQEIDFQLNDDIDKVLKNLGKKYEKALDKILDDISLDTPPPIPPKDLLS